MSVVTLDEVRRHLNIGAGTHDDELAQILDAAEAVIAQNVGPLAPTTVTSRVYGGRLSLFLPMSPVISITSVTPVGGTALNLADVQLDTASGEITNVLAGAFGYTTYDVVYVAGRTTLPADLVLAVLELTRHLWESQRSPARFPSSTISEGPVASTASGYLLPFRVQELLAPHLQLSVA